MKSSPGVVAGNRVSFARRRSLRGGSPEAARRREETAGFHDDFQGKVSRLGFLAGAYGEAPWQVAREEIAAIRKRAEDYFARFNALVSGDVAAYNRAASQQGVPMLFAGDPIRIEEPAL